MESQTNTLIFTDMDGTLLDHYTYEFTAVSSLLTQLENHHIPVIPVSSKTKAELSYLRDKLNNTHPFIVENGAAIYIPEHYFSEQPADTELNNGFWIKSFVEPRQHWQKMLDSLAERFGIHYKTFDQVGVEGIMDMTGLDYDSALRASQRQFGEPLAWYGSTHQKQQFINALTKLGANVLQGGRFMHISGSSDKGKALIWLTEQYTSHYNMSSLKTIAAGDSQNDQAMLENANIALVIKSPVHDFPTLDRTDNCYYSEQCGPEGWSNSMKTILSSLNITLNP
jgi:mannosyl-3-phosphoglycerate phosphatase family protein